MGRMGGLPDDDHPGRAVSRAERLVVRDGRPLRMRTLCLVAGAEPGAWGSMSREQQIAAMEPFIDHEAERWHWAASGELFIVDARVARNRSDVSEVSLERLQATATAERQFAKWREKLSREAFSRGFAEAVQHVAPMLVQLDERFLEEGLAAEATDAEKDRAVKVARELKERLGGKAVAPQEDVTARDSDARAFMARSRPRVLPVSAHVSVEQAGEQVRRELEAGLIVEDEDA